MYNLCQRDLLLPNLYFQEVKFCEIIDCLVLQARESLEVQQQIAVDKLMSTQTKTRISMDKQHSKILKKMAKEGKSTEQKQNQLKGELQELLTIQDLKVWSHNGLYP